MKLKVNMKNIEAYREFMKEAKSFISGGKA
jgi:hypothetical protein